VAIALLLVLAWRFTDYLGTGGMANLSFK
jgi:hypothetical protein